MASPPPSLSLLLLSLLLHQAAAATYYVSPDGSNTNDGSQGNPFQQIQYALDQSGSNDVIILLSGTYLADGNSNLSVVAGRDIIIHGEDWVNDVPLVTIMLGGNVFLRSNSVGSTVSVMYIIFQGGSKVFDITASISMNFIFSYNVVQDCSDNSTAGGAVSLSFLTGSGLAEFRSVSFSNNLANYPVSYLGSGGAIYVYSAVAVNVLIKSCSFYMNQARHYGGAVFLNVSSNSNVLMACNNTETASLRSNLALISGGAVYMSGSQNMSDSLSTTATFSSCRFSFNNASAYGGAVALYRTSTTLTDGYYISNALNAKTGYPDSCGGAIYVNGGTLTTQSSAPGAFQTFFIYNTAWNQGGAVCLLNTSDFNFFRDTAWVGNLAYRTGSHIYVSGGGGSTIFDRASFECEDDSCIGVRYDIVAGPSSSLEFSSLYLSTKSNTTKLDSLLIDESAKVTIGSYTNADQSSRALQIGGNFYMGKDSYFLVNAPLTLAQSCEFEWVGGVLESGGKGVPMTLSNQGIINILDRYAVSMGGPKTLVDFDLYIREHATLTGSTGEALTTSGNVFVDTNGTWSVLDNFSLLTSNPSLTFQSAGVMYVYNTTIKHSVVLLPTSTTNVNKAGSELTPPFVVDNYACFQGNLSVIFPSDPSSGDTYGIIGYKGLTCGDRFGFITIRDFASTVYSFYDTDLLSIRTSAFKDDSELGGGAVAAIVVCLLIGILGITVASYYYWYKNRATEEDDESVENFMSTSDRKYGSVGL